MKETLKTTGEYLLKSSLATVIQLFVLLGLLLLLSFIMNFIARKNEELSYKVLGQKVYLYLFGWLGIAVHELGHAIFAVLFAHKISEIKLFTPSSGKSLGHVKHSYKSGNPYQTVGNFFIGIGPILLGTCLLWLVVLLLFDLNIFRIAGKHDVEINSHIFTSIELVKTTFANIGKGVWECFETIFSENNKNAWWRRVLFIYLFYSIGSSVTLSSSDIKGASRGFFYFVILLLLFNIATIWNGDITTRFFENTSNRMSGFYFLIVLSMALNLVFIVILWFIGVIIELVAGKKSAPKSK